MVSVDEADSHYLPPLGKCLDGTERIVPWREVSEALHSTVNVNDVLPLVRRFLEDPQSIDALSRASDLPRATSTQTKSDFETRTAAINVTPKENGSYSLAQIKDDTNWLSKQAGIDEITALRIVIIEWQSRSATKVLRPFTEEENISLAQALGHRGQTGFLDPSIGHSQDGDLSNFSTDDSRRFRLLRLWLEEKLNLRVVAVVICEQVPSGSESSHHQYESGHEPSVTWLSEVARKTLDLTHKRLESTSASADLINHDVEVVQKELQTLEQGQAWEVAPELRANLDDSFQCCQLAVVVLLLRLIFLHIDKRQTFISLEATSAWYKFMDDFTFFNTFTPMSEDHGTFVSSMQILSSLISLQILDLPQSLQRLSNSATAVSRQLHIMDSSCQKRITQTLINAAESAVAIASPAMLAWAILLQRLQSEVSYHLHDANSSDDGHADSQSQRPGAASSSKQFLDALDNLSNTTLQEDPLEFFAKMSVEELQVFEVITSLGSQAFNAFEFSSIQSSDFRARLLLQDLIRESCVMTTYSPEIVEAIIAVCYGNEFSYEKFRSRMSTNFLHDHETLVPQILSHARSRYPHDLSPFLNLCQVLSYSDLVDEESTPIMTQALMVASKFTQRLPADFAGYEPAREEEGSNNVRLKEHLPLLLQARRKPRFTTGLNSRQLDRYDPSQRNRDFISAGTAGTVVSETRPFVVTWSYEHSSLSYLASLVEAGLANSDKVEASTLEKPSLDAIADIIRIVGLQLENGAKLAKVAKNFISFTYVARQLLQDAGERLESKQDFVNVVADTFEQVLAMHNLHSIQNPIPLLVSCMDFFRSLLPIFPEKIWPILVSSQLLSIDSRGGRISALVASYEIPNGRFDFLESCLKLLESLIDDVKTHAVTSREKQRTIARFAEDDFSYAHVQPKNKAKVLSALSNVFSEFLDNSFELATSKHDQRLAMNAQICDIFESLLRSVYGHPELSSTSKDFLQPLLPVANSLSALFFEQKNSSTLSTVLKLLAFGISERSLQTKTYRSSLVRHQTMNALRLLDTIVQLAYTRFPQHAHIKNQVLHGMPVLVRLYVQEETYKSALQDLLADISLLANSGQSSLDSILGEINQLGAEDFLAVLAASAKLDLNHNARLWHLLATLVGSRQQWIASFLLAGETPKSILKRKHDEGASPKSSVLSFALDKLATLPTMSTLGAIEALKFVAAAQNNYPWVTNTIRRQGKFVTKMIDFMQEFRREPLNASNAASIELALTTQSVATIAEILAVHIHNMRQLGDSSLVKSLVPKLGFLGQSGVASPWYNYSLHRNLQQNFETKFKGCTLSQLQTNLGFRRVGDSFYYDLKLANDLLLKFPSWEGAKDNGFHQELVRANINLSLVESQVQAFNSWKLLAIELSRHLSAEVRLEKSLGYVVHECLLANHEIQPVVTIFDDMSYTRAELALLLLQRLVLTKSNAPVMRSLLNVAWEALQRSGQDPSLAFSGPNTDYYRLLLQILMLCLQPHTENSKRNKRGEQDNAEQADAFREKIDVTSTVLSIIVEAVATPFKSLATQLHEDSSSVSPEDFILLTAILRTALQVRPEGGSPNPLREEAALRLADSNIHRYALALFSWAERVGAASGEGLIYGQCSISLLVELSTLQTLAQFMASEGILASLGNGEIFAILRSPQGINPITGLAHVYAIWSQGILPLCLNLLMSVGESFTVDAVTFLNQFEGQLLRISGQLDSKSNPSISDPTSGCLTLGIVREVHVLSLFSNIAIHFANAPESTIASEVPELKWDRARVKDDAENWLQGSRAALRERILPTNTREATLVKEKATQTGFDNRLEEIIVGELQGIFTCLSAF